ncbi:MAG: DUF4105 domain-containing protein [Candidatus Ozemobacteraceae bacterium]
MIRSNRYIFLQAMFFGMTVVFVIVSSVSASQNMPFADVGSIATPIRSEGAMTPSPTGDRLPELGFSIPYTLEGLITVNPEGVTLHTSDMRVFFLMMSADQAKPFAGRTVYVEGLAKQSDQLGQLKIKKITVISPNEQQKIVAPFKAHQAPPSLVSRNEDTFVIRNVRWDWEMGSASQPLAIWETATIKPDLVENIYFVKKPFPPEWIAAHAFLIFTFKPGGLVDSRDRSSNALVLSVEAYQRTDQNFDLKAGLKKTFAVSWILATWQNYLDQSCKYDKEKMIPYRSTLSEPQKAAMVREALEQATVNRAGEFYHTVLNNCTNNLVVLFNHVLPKDKQIRMWLLPSFIYNFRATMPVLVPNMLIKNGLLEKALPEINRANFVTDIEAWRKKL